MSDDDLIRRGDAMAAYEAAADSYNNGSDGRWFRHHLADAIAALPAVTPAPDAAAIREAWGKAYWRMRSYAIHDNDCKLNKPPHFNGPCSCGLTAALEEALALITKGGDGRRVYMGQIMAECDCPREAECQAAGRCIAEGRR